MRIEVCAVSCDLGFGAKNDYASLCRPPSLAAEFINAIQTAGVFLHQVERRLQIQAQGRSMQGSGPFERDKILQPSNPTPPLYFLAELPTESVSAPDEIPSKCRIPDDCIDSKRSEAMLIALHKNARTTPAVRAEIAASNEPASVLAQRFGITEQTVYKWKKRDVFADRSHTAHRLQTVLTPAQETVVVHLRRTLLLPLDDLLAVTREFLSPDVSRSGLDRCLRRHGAGNLNALKPQEPAVAHKAFKSYEPGYVHMDVKYLPQMQDESSRRYLFVAIDRATRWVFVQLKSNKTAASAQAFLKALHKACPIRINKLLTDNGKEFTDRLFASREREPSGNHEFDQLCQELGIEHRLTKPRTPRTNGMVERFNGRIADVLKTHRFNSREDMEQTLLRYVALYNHQLPQSALRSCTPMQAMKEWHQTHPHLFHKRPYDRPGCDT
eukprot:gene36680-47814_t